MSNRPTRFYLSPEAKQDLQRLHDLAQGTPRGSAAQRLATVALNTVLAIKNHGHSTHPLEYMPSYPDLSDCETTYVGADPNRKPSHRVVWRETPGDTEQEQSLREIIAIGERQHGAAYHLAGQRLGRPVGVPLSELAGRPEPLAARSRQLSRPAPLAPDAAGPEFG
jgi:hypothetical protein